MYNIKFAPIKKRGFTLIELLLVLALITALTAAGITAYQLQLRNFRVDKTALQMQQWLQAGQAFYVDCGQWPDPNTGTDKDSIISQMTGVSPLSPIACPSNKDPTKVVTYLPKGSGENGPWANSYIIGPFDPNATPYPPPTSPAFFVKTYLLGADNTNNAQMIAGRLPNAIVGRDGGGVFVQAVVAMPTSSGGGGPTGGYIVDMEMVAAGKTAKHIKMPDANTCPQGMKAVLVGAISNIDAGVYAGNFDRVGLNQTYFDTNKNTIDENGFISKVSTDATTHKIIPSLVVLGTQDNKTPLGPGTGKAPGTHQILFISACLPNTTLSTNTNMPLRSNTSLRY